MGLHVAVPGDQAGAQVINGVRMPTAIELRLVADLLPYARNSREHTPASTAALVGLIQRFGWTNPVLVAEAGIVAGHGRVLAAQKLGLVRVPCIDVSHLSEDDRRALVIADNRSGELSGWSLENLKAETDYLREIGDLEELTGFSEEALAEELAGLDDDEPDVGGDPDDTPPVPDEPHSRVGDVWVCGPHRVACGDCADPHVWDALMDGALADVCLTDPPYNVDVGNKHQRMDKAIGGSRAKTGKIAGDKLSGPEFERVLAVAYLMLFDALKPGGVIYVMHSDKEGRLFRSLFEDAGFHFSQSIIWRKNVHTLGMADFQPIHEPILYGWKPGSRHRWYGGRKQTTVMEFGDGGPFTQMEDGRWQIRVGDAVMVVSGEATVEERPSSVVFEAKPAKSGLHPTQKPVALVERLLKQSARPGDLVVDAFGGSGTTLVAADRLGMCARLCEVDPKFCDVIVRRWEMLTGRRAVHAVTGEQFPGDGGERAPVATAPATPVAEGDVDVF